MSSQNTTNSTSFIEAQQYSQFILRNMDFGNLPTTMYRNVSEFGMGTTLNIKTIGAAQIQEVSEESALTYNAIDTGNVTLQITDYIGDAWSVTDILRQDGNQIEALMAARAQEATKAINDYFESRFLAVSNAAQTAANANVINGFAHRLVASGTNDTLVENDLINLGLAFDEAEVPVQGRIGIVSPSVRATFQKLVVITGQVDMNPTNQALMENGFDTNHQFVMSIHGWNLWVSNKLASVATETIGGTTITDAKANVFMCIADDQTKPIMVAWRQMPKVEGERNKDLQRDEFLTTARFGMGAQRVDTLGIILASATASA
jgi:hypothetical protein